MKGNITFTVLGIEVWRITAEHETPNTPPNPVDTIGEAVMGGFRKAALKVGRWSLG